MFDNFVSDEAGGSLLITFAHSERDKSVKYLLDIGCTRWYNNKTLPDTEELLEIGEKNPKYAKCYNLIYDKVKYNN